MSSALFVATENTTCKLCHNTISHFRSWLYFWLPLLLPFFGAGHLPLTCAGNILQHETLLKICCGCLIKKSTKNQKTEKLKLWLAESWQTGCYLPNRGYGAGRCGVGTLRGLFSCLVSCWLKLNQANYFYRWHASQTQELKPHSGTELETVTQWGRGRGGVAQVRQPRPGPTLVPRAQCIN